MSEEKNGLLDWWQKNQNTYPKLAHLARQIFCVPASSSSSERVFSAAGRIIEERRTRLKPDTVDSLLFLHAAWRRDSDDEGDGEEEE